MRLGIFAKTFPGSAPSPVLRQARAAGFAAVQYNMACSGLPSMTGAFPACTTTSTPPSIESSTGSLLQSASSASQVARPSALEPPVR